MGQMHELKGGSENQLQKFGLRDGVTHTFYNSGGASARILKNRFSQLRDGNTLVDYVDVEPGATLEITRFPGSALVTRSSGISQAVLDAAIATVLAGDGFNTEVAVRSALDLTGSLDSTKVYRLDGQIDMGSTKVLVPEGGLTISGFGFVPSKLFSSVAGHELFAVDPAGAYSGNLDLAAMTIAATGAGARLFNLDNDGNGSAVEFDKVNIGDFGAQTASLGLIDGYRQVFMNNCGLFNFADGLTLDGTMTGGLRVENTLTLQVGAGATVFKAGANLLIQGGVSTGMNNVSMAADGALFDYAPANFDTNAILLLDGVRTSATVPLPNITRESVHSRFKNCQGIPNTHRGGWIEWTGETASPLTADVPIKAAGTTSANDLQWCDAPADNRLRYLGELPMDGSIRGELIVDGGPDDEIAVYVRRYDASAAAFVNERVILRAVSNFVGGDDVARYDVTCSVDIDKDDYLEMWVENRTDNTNVTVKNGSFYRLSER